jgi:hypothetical protein
MSANPSRNSLRADRKVIFFGAALTLLVHLLTNHRYGYFRDELYFIACARRLDFGYVDMAPFSAFLLRIELILFGTSLFALRLFPAIAGALTVAFTGAFARALGGQAWAVALLTPARRHFAQKWIWLGGVIALVIALPNILWQIEHGWPTWVLLRDVERAHKNVVLTPAEFFGQQILLLNPATFPIWFGGLLWVFLAQGWAALPSPRPRLFARAG